MVFVELQRCVYIFCWSSKSSLVVFPIYFADRQGSQILSKSRLSESWFSADHILAQSSVHIQLPNSDLLFH